MGDKTSTSGDELNKLETVLHDSVESWRKMPIALQIWTLLGVPISLASLASLSDQLVKWAHFVEAALKMYRAVTEFILHPLQLAIPWTIHQISVDVAVLSLVYAIPAARFGNTLPPSIFSSPSTIKMVLSNWPSDTWPERFTSVVVIVASCLNPGFALLTPTIFALFFSYITISQWSAS